MAEPADVYSVIRGSELPSIPSPVNSFDRARAAHALTRPSFERHDQYPNGTTKNTEETGERMFSRDKGPRYPKSMVDLGPVPRDSLQIPAGPQTRHAAPNEIVSKIPRPEPTVTPAESHQSSWNGGQRVKSSALFSGNDEEKREPLGKDVGGSTINPSVFTRLDETPAESGARAVLAKSGGIQHAKETASGESPVTSQMATGVLKSSAGPVGHSTTTSAVLKRVVGAESSSEDEGETTHAATKGIRGRSAKPKPAGLEKLLGSVANSKPVVITEGDDEFEI